MKPLRILHVDTGTDWRGGQAQVAALLTGLARRGHEQTLAAPAGPLADRAREAGIAVAPWQGRSDADLRAALALAALARRLQPEVVHLHSARAHALGAWAARRAQAVCIVSRRVDFDVATHPLSKLKYALPVDRYLCISEGVRAVLRRAGIAEGRLALARSGIDVDRVARDVDEARATGRGRSLRAAWGFDSGAPLVGMVAALAAHKDHPTFLEAARRVHDERPEVRFVCAGGGPESDRVRALRRSLGLETVVALPGFLADVSAVLATIDLFVLSSYLEGLGTSVLDAQASGVPVIATRVGGIPEMVEDGVTGSLVPPRDPRAMARAILAALDDRAGAEARARTARNRVAAFDVEVTVTATEACYRDALAGHRAPARA